jgi:choline dehydrogenase-like flavoprotein
MFGESNSFTSQPIGYALCAPGNPTMKHLWGADLKRYLKTFPRAISLAAFVEDLPMQSNSIDLDPVVKDSYGLPVPRITHRQHPNDLALYRWAGSKLMDVAQAAGGQVQWQPAVPGLTFFDEKNAMRGGIHLMGTCRMGDDPGKSVLNRWCRTHDVENLWVVDGSCFPTSAAYNPTLTILANAYRVADHFIREAKRLNLS